MGCALVDDAILPWKDPTNSWDANGDGRTSAFDSLLIIKPLGRGGATNIGDLEFDASFLDVTADSMITARDALVVINEQRRLNAVAATEYVDDIFSKLADDEDAMRLFDNNVEDSLAQTIGSRTRR